MPPSPPRTGIVVEAIVGEAPSRHFPGICSGRWKMSPQPGGMVCWSLVGGISCQLCFRGGSGFLSACSCSLDSGVGGGWGDSPLPLTLSLVLGV